MAVTVEGFISFARVFRPGRPAAPALGILTIRPNAAQRTEPIPIAKGSVFSTTQLRFQSIEDAALSESAHFLPLAVQCQTPGAAGNLAAGASWSSNVAGVSAQNENAFAGGRDATEAVGDMSDAYASSLETDSDLQGHLEVAKAQIRMRLGGPSALPDFPEVDRAIYLYAQWTRQQRTFQERQRSLGEAEDFHITETSYFRQEATQNALDREIASLLASHIDVEAFMPDA